jgi:hypothetical protein
MPAAGRRPVTRARLTRLRISPEAGVPSLLTTQLREPPKTSGVPPQKSHKSASRTAPTDIPRTRRHSAAHPGTHAKVEKKPAFDQAERRFRRLSAVPIGGDVFTFGADLGGRGSARGLLTG